MFEREAEALPRQSLADLQLERLRATIERVTARVPFYREQLASTGITSQPLRSLEDLSRLPFTRKSDLRDNYPFGFFAVPRTDLVRLHATSGTLGKPTVVGYTPGDIDLWARCCARCLVCAGANPGNIVHNAFGYGLFTGGLGLHYGAERMGATVVPASGGNTPRQILLLQDFGARVVCCTPSYALNIAGVMADHGISHDMLALEIGIFGAEPWTEELRRHLERTLGITALDIYGLSEVLGPGVAMECPEGREGLHVWEDHFLPEIVDPASGDLLPDGRYGELVLTTLTKEAMPVIRFRTGDITAILTDECRCGRTHRRIARISARTDDMLIVRGVNVSPSEVERVLLGISGIAPHYQVVVDRRASLDTIEVQVEVTSAFGASAQDVVALATLRDRVNDALDAALGVATDVVLNPPNALPRSEGKAVRVHDRRIG